MLTIVAPIQRLGVDLTRPRLEHFCPRWRLRVSVEDTTTPRFLDGEAEPRQMPAQALWRGFSLLWCGKIQPRPRQTQCNGSTFVPTVRISIRCLLDFDMQSNNQPAVVGLVVLMMLRGSH